MEEKVVSLLILTYMVINLGNSFLKQHCCPQLPPRGFG